MVSKSTTDSSAQPDVAKLTTLEKQLEKASDAYEEVKYRRNDDKIKVRALKKYEELQKKYSVAKKRAERRPQQTGKKKDDQSNAEPPQAKADWRVIEKPQMQEVGGVGDLPNSETGTAGTALATSGQEDRERESDGPIIPSQAAIGVDGIQFRDKRFNTGLNDSDSDELTELDSEPEDNGGSLERLPDEEGMDVDGNDNHLVVGAENQERLEDSGHHIEVDSLERADNGQAVSNPQSAAQGNFDMSTPEIFMDSVGEKILEEETMMPSASESNQEQISGCAHVHEKDSFGKEPSPGVSTEEDNQMQVDKDPSMLAQDNGLGSPRCGDATMLSQIPCASNPPFRAFGELDQDEQIESKADDRVIQEPLSEGREPPRVPCQSDDVIRPSANTAPSVRDIIMASLADDEQTVDNGRLGESNAIQDQEKNGEGNVEQVIESQLEIGETGVDAFRDNEVLRFVVPNTAEELLKFNFVYETIDWDDEAIEFPMRLHDESEEDYQHRVNLHTKESSLQFAVRQMEYLGAVYTAVEEKWEGMEIRPKPGLEKMQYLKAEMSAIEKAIGDLRAEFEQAKKEHDSHFEKKVSIEVEKALHMEVEALRGQFLIAAPDELQQIRDNLVQKIAALEKLTSANVDRGKKKSRQRKVDVKSKGALKAPTKEEDDATIVDDEEPADPVIAPSGTESAPRTKYLTLDDSGREEMIEKGRRQLERVMRAPTELARRRALQAIDFSIRRAAREVQEFLPEASYLARDIALTFHYTSSKNFVCRFHGRNRGYSSHDDAAFFRGVGFPKNYSSKEHGRKEPEPGHLNCGCHEDDVLMDFFIWKTFGAFSSNPRLASKRHCFDDDDVLHPKVRRVWVQQWKESTGLSVDDIYGNDGGSPMWPPRLMAKSIMKQIDRLREFGVGIGLGYCSELDRVRFSELAGIEEPEDETAEST